MSNVWAPIIGLCVSAATFGIMAGEWHGTRAGRCAALREVTEELAVTPSPARDRTAMVELSTWYQAKAKGEGCW